MNTTTIQRGYRFSSGVIARGVAVPSIRAERGVRPTVNGEEVLWPHPAQHGPGGVAKIFVVGKPGELRGQIIRTTSAIVPER